MRVTLKQIVEATGLPRATIYDRCRRESWPSCGTTVVNHNETKLYAVKDLPADIQRFFNTASLVPPLACPAPAPGETTSAAAPARGFFAAHSAVAGTLPAGRRSAGPGTSTGLASKRPEPLTPAAVLEAIPEAAKKIGLARFDLLRIWEEFRARFDSLTQGDREFEQYYQGGHALPQIHGVLGDVTVKTLRRWKQQIAGSSDWRLLVPNYKWSGMVIATSLSIPERRLFEQFLLDPRRLQVSQAIFYTRIALERQGIESAAGDMTFRRYAHNFKKTHFDVWTFRRDGNKALMDKALHYIKRDAGLLEVGQVLVADGHRLNFQVINPFTGKPARATMIGYLDWKSYQLAGYEIMLEENTQCIASALRNAVLNLGKAPQFSYQDNGKAFRAKYFTNTPSLEEAGLAGLFGRFNILPVFSLPYNARAKVIERFWGIFSNSFERLLPSYVGASIDDKPAYMMRNEKFHRALRGDFTPTVWEAIEMIDQWIELWSSRTECPHIKGQSVKQVFDSGKGPGVDPGELDDLMMSAKITKIYQNGIKLWTGYYWHEALYGKKWEEVIVRYSIFDKSTVRVYAKTGALICTATRTEDMNPLVNYLGTEAEKERFKNVIELRGRMRKSTVDRSRQILEAPLPIAVNAEAVAQAPAPRTPGVQPGALMLRQVKEQAQNIETLKAGADIAQSVPLEEPAPRPKLAMFECELEEQNS